jgi:pyruvate dehydrogenase E1 component alpha subunit
MFQHVYAESHPLIEEQAAWLKGYEASFGEAPAQDGGAA